MARHDTVADSLADVTNAASLARLSHGWSISATPASRAVVWIHAQVATTVQVLARVLCQHIVAIVGSLVITPSKGMDIVFVLQDPPCFDPGALPNAAVQSVVGAVSKLRAVCISGEPYVTSLIPLPAAAAVQPASKVPHRPFLVRTSCDSQHRNVVGCVRVAHDPTAAVMPSPLRAPPRNPTPQ